MNYSSRRAVRAGCARPPPPLPCGAPIKVPRTRSAPGGGASPREKAAARGSGGGRAGGGGSEARKNLGEVLPERGSLQPRAARGGEGIAGRTRRRWRARGPVMAGSRRAVRELCRSFGHYNRHLARLQHNLRETKRFFRDVKYSQGHPLASALAGDDPPSAGDGDGGPGDGPAAGGEILLFCFISESRGIFPWKNLSKPALFFFPQEVDIVVAPCRSFQPAEATLAELVPQVLPVVTFAISEPQLSPADQAELRQIKAKFSLPIFFLCSPDPELTAPKKPLPEEKSSLRSQLLELGYLSPSEPPCGCGGGARSSLAEQPDKLRLLSVFCRQLLQEHLVEAATRLNELHCRCLNIFIDQAFDMQRDLQITPKRLEYTRRKENELYESLMGIANRKQEEMKDVIVETLGNMKEELLEDAAGMEFRDIIIPENGEPVSSKDIKCCIKQIQELIISRLNQAVANKLISSVDYLRESFVGTLERCLKSLEESWEDGSVHITSNYLKQILNAAYHVEVTFHSGSTVTRMLWEQIKQVQTLGKESPGLFLLSLSHNYLRKSRVLLPRPSQEGIKFINSQL
uniref:Dual serine/threonine and tyrosine protein kinase n=1 Tax=Malurus cyaneus samueli TaxID=2593467 RepID=A0A8C5TJ20_9PASS